MNYYERHLGDYARDTAHLTMLEHGAYTLLMDRYYVTEQGIPADQAHRVSRARSEDEKAAVDVVLNEFFVLKDGVWIKGRIEEEITKAQTKIKAAQENGKRGGRPKLNPNETQNKPGGFSVGFENETQEKAHQTPDTNHQSPVKEQTHTEENLTSVEPNYAASVCLAMKHHGIIDINPTHPTLQALVASGATIDEFMQAAQQAVQSGKKFAYAIGIVKRQREEAAKLILHHGAMPHAPPKTQSIHDKRSATAKAMFGDLNGNDNTRIIDVSDYSTEPNRSLISANG